MKFIRSIRENLKDPKKKSITILGIYILFFIFVFFVLRTGESVKYNDNYDKNNNNDVLNYEYTYKIIDNENTIEVNGIFKDDIDRFNYNGLSYTKQNNLIYLNGSLIEDFNFDIDRYKYKTLELLIENSDSKTTYKDDNKVVYNISTDKYFNLLNEENNCDTIDCTAIIIPITILKDNFINSAFIDLSSYYGYVYTIQINYNNINNLY